MLFVVHCSLSMTAKHYYINKIVTTFRDFMETLHMNCPRLVTFLTNK
jgi:hypothetical protein